MGGATWAIRRGRVDPPGSPGLAALAASAAAERSLATSLVMMPSFGHSRVLQAACNGLLHEATRGRDASARIMPKSPDIGRLLRLDVGGRPRKDERVQGGALVSTQPLVLVADDEPRITKLVSIALQAEGF